MRITMVAVLLAMHAWAQSLLDAPRIGRIASRSGVLREVRGVAGAFVLGPAAAGDVVLGSERRLVAFAEDVALLYFPAARQFAWWREGRLEPVDWRIGGEVLSLRLTTRGAEIAVRRDGATWIVNPAGAVLESLPDATGPVLLLDESLLYVAGEVVVRRKDGREETFDVAGVTDLFAVSARYAGARTAAATFLIDLERAAVFQLPEAAE
jgi:hypothetical protein